MINKPDAWATIFATQGVRRSFVDICLERSHPVPLEVTLSAHNKGPAHSSCTCDKDHQLRLVPNEIKPCEWHFVFESLAETRNSNRMHTLDLILDIGYSSAEKPVPLALESCRFFNIPSLQLTSLKWTDKGPVTKTADHLFSASPFVPTLRSLYLQGSWDGQVMKLNNLTSFTLDQCGPEISAESFRTFFLNNESLEMLSLEYIKLKGVADSPPVVLPNIKSLSIHDPDDYSQKTISTLFCVPALRRLSSLLISLTATNSPTLWFTLRSSGDNIVFTVSCDDRIAEAWQDFTGYAKPTIQHLRLENPADIDLYGDWSEAIKLFVDLHTLEIGNGCAYPYPDIFDDLKELGSQLKTIRFEIPEGTEPVEESGTWYEELLENIAALVVYRFEHGRPLSSVERMAVGEKWNNRQQDFVWKCFYEDRRLDQYLQPEWGVLS